MPKKPASNIIDLANHRRDRDRMGPGRAEQKALDRAQELIYRGWEVMDPIERVEIAEQALDISALCADAWVMLAEDAAETLEEEIEYYVKAVEAGERSLGEAFFEQEVGRFWGIPETRPYMRARAGLAHCLWDQGEHDAALAHYEELLELNPADNQWHPLPARDQPGAARAPRGGAGADGCQPRGRIFGGVGLQSGPDRLPRPGRQAPEPRVARLRGTSEPVRAGLPLGGLAHAQVSTRLRQPGRQDGGSFLRLRQSPGMARLTGVGRVAAQGECRRVTSARFTAGSR
ncbi:MAG: hypothetical protein M5U09_08535 [Gammaproteobacteria bacterium]|nr:hypothetical protein [Gammaproteobacteria bacterium]